VIEHKARRARLLVVLAALVLVSGCGAATKSVDFFGRPVDPAFKVDPAPLENTEGEEVTLGADAHAKPLRLVFFGYTHCADICPTVLGSLASGVAKLRGKDRARVQVYFATTDPDRDTRKVLRAYVARFNANFDGLAGSLDVVSRVALSVGIYVDGGSGVDHRNYDPASHSTYVVAIGKDGHAPAFWNAETAPFEFASDFRFLLNGAS